MSVNTITLRAKDLLSRKTREQVGKIRVIDFDKMLGNSQAEQGFLPAIQQIAGGIFNALRGFAGFLWSNVAVPFFKLIVQPIFNWVGDKVMNLWTFDWNQTDAELRMNVQSAKINLIRSLGTLVGSGAAWLVSIAVGYGIGSVIPVFGSKLLAQYVAGSLKTEAFFDLSSKASTVWNNLIYLGLETALTESYIGIRSALRSGTNELARKFFGDQLYSEISAKIKSNQGKPWSFAIEYERQIGRIKNAELRAFVESLLESGADTFIEAGYVIGESITDYINEQKASQGKFSGVYVYPDKDSGEGFYLEGGILDLKQRVSGIIDQSRLLGNRDIGYVFDGGEYKQEPLPNFQSRCLHVKFVSKEKPPIPWNDKDFQTVSITIPHLKRSVTWESIKSACSPWNYGKFGVVARLDTGNKMTIWASSYNEAETKLNELLQLSTAKILTTTMHTQGKQPKERIKRNVRVYPYKASLILQTPVKTGDKGWTDVEGKRHERARKPFNLYPDKKPDNVPKEL